MTAKTKTERIARILELHGVPYYIKDGRIYADSMYADMQLFEEVVDLTDCTRPELYDWLGYAWLEE